MAEHHDHGHGYDHGHGHENGHSHDHAPKVGAGNERRVLWALVLTASFMLVEVAGGLISGSLALLADAGHMLTDAASLGLALYAFRVSRRRPDLARTYGYQRAQVLAAFVNGLALLAISVWIMVEAVLRLFQPVRVMGALMLAVAAAGLAVNLVAFAVLRGGQQENLNLRGALLHVMGDLLGSVAAIVAAGVIMASGFMPVDPLLSLLVSALILRAGWKVVRGSAHILMEGSPPSFDTEAMRETLVREVDGVRDVHHVHAWTMSPDRPPLVTLHVDAADGVDLERVASRVREILHSEFGIEHATIQVETAGCEDESCRLG